MVRRAKTENSSIERSFLYEKDTYLYIVKFISTIGIILLKKHSHVVLLVHTVRPTSEGDSISNRNKSMTRATIEILKRKASSRNLIEKFTHILRLHNRST
jgi:hypothetical protein